MRNLLSMVPSTRGTKSCLFENNLSTPAPMSLKQQIASCLVLRDPKLSLLLSRKQQRQAAPSL